ncbi:MAG TPA: ABC transporter ATP-binding protein [Anaerolineales bacterium]|jgi:ABC-2 type transport system ATP-binding protein
MKSDVATFKRSNVPALVEAVDLHKSFGDTRAVDGVSLTVAPGEVLGLVGSDGAGKTTTMRLLVGALRADSGSVDICGYDVASNAEDARAQIGYLSQRFSLYEDLTVLENIRFFAEVRGLSAQDWKPRSLEILDFVGLGEFTGRRAGQLSGGMKQKLGLATALVTRPRVLLLDEPTTGVDPVTRQDFWQLIIRLTSAPLSHSERSRSIPERSEGRAGAEGQENDRVAVLISTPYMDEASRCHRVAFMRAGKIITEGPPSTLRAVLNNRILELRGRPLNQLRHLATRDPDVDDVRAFGDRLHLRVREHQAESVMKRLPAELRKEGAEVTELRVVQPSLEDVFISLLEGSQANGAEVTHD